MITKKETKTTLILELTEKELEVLKAGKEAVWEYLQCAWYEDDTVSNITSEINNRICDLANLFKQLDI